MSVFWGDGHNLTHNVRQQQNSTFIHVLPATVPHHPRSENSYILKSPQCWRLPGSMVAIPLSPALTLTPSKLLLYVRPMWGAQRQLAGNAPISLLFPFVNRIWQLSPDSPVPLGYNQLFVCCFCLGVYMQLGTVSCFPKRYCVLKKTNLNLFN